MYEKQGIGSKDWMWGFSQRFPRMNMWLSKINHPLVIFGLRTYFPQTCDMRLWLPNGIHPRHTDQEPGALTSSYVSMAYKHMLEKRQKDEWGLSKSRWCPFEFAAVSQGTFAQNLGPTALAPFREKTVVIGTDAVLIAWIPKTKERKDG